MSSDDLFDLVAIGGGTAGLVTAAVSAALGARTALVERDRLGGECLWTGCVPSKALIGSARIARAFRRGPEFGLRAAEPGRDGGAVLESVRAVRARIQPHDDPERFRAMGVEVVEGEARFRSAGELRVEGPAGARRLRARRFVIATGSRPTVPPIPGLEECGYQTHETAFDRATLPRSVAIIGAGAIGVEFAQAYRRLGIEVALLEREDRILVAEDPGPADLLRALLEREGVAIRTGVRVAKVERPGGPGAPVRLSLEEREADSRGAEGRAGEPGFLEAEEVLVAAGRRPNVEALGVEAIGVETGPTGIAVDDRLRTSRPHIFAAGDVTGGLLFTHVADHEARAVARNALFPFPGRVSYRAVPWVTYTEPELAHLGPTEPEARERHGDGVRAFTYDLAELDRAIVDRAAEGMVKVLVDRRGRILGAHILAPSAGTMIVELALAMKHGIRLGKLSELVHPYPTMSEAVRRAADDYRRSALTDSKRRWLERWFALARRLARP